MPLLFYSVTLILFAVSVTATPPPGHVHRANDDKNVPNYEYKYEIGDVDGKESHGKVETRSGDLASGRYYVNDDRSSTDVRYFADEWGYHPLVKYRAANDHSAATAHFALGEHVVKALLLNGTELGKEVKLLGEKENKNNEHRRPIQVVQPYTAVTSDSEFRTVSPVNSLLNYHLEGTVSRGSPFHDPSTTSSASDDVSVSGFQENFNNYVTLPRISTNDRDHQRQSDVRGGHSSSAVGASSTPDYRTNVSKSPESLRSSVRLDSTQENHEIVRESSNDLLSTVSEDILLVQNAGSFGRRLNPGSFNSNSFESTGQTFSTSRPISGTPPSSNIFYRTESVEDSRQLSTTPIPDYLSNEYKKNSINVSDNSYGGPKENSLFTDNSSVIGGYKKDTRTEPERVTSLSAYDGKIRDHELYVTLRQSLDSEIRDLSRLYSSTPQTLSTFNSKPIVVAELFNNYNSDKGFEYSTTFPCTEESYEISTTPASPILVTPKLRGSTSHHITTSSVILNPIQAGVSLINAGETEIISSVEQSNRSPAPVNENIENEPVEEPIKNGAADRTGDEIYERVNAAFGQTSSTRTIAGDPFNDGRPSNSHDQQIEIQKSVEIYQNAAVHEIHYPAEPISQVSDINHQSEQHGENSVHQHELQDVANAKQFQQRYNNVNGQDREYQSIENSRGGPGVYTGNIVRLEDQLADYRIHEHSRNPPREDLGDIIKIIRESIPEIKYTPAKTPSINVYPSSLPEENETGKFIKTEENSGKKIVKADQQVKKVQSELYKILSESSGVQRYLSHQQRSPDHRGNQPQQEQRCNVDKEKTDSYLAPPGVVERVVHKTIHVPQPYPVEVPKIIEKKVPYPVEKIVEKKVPVPQPYPVRVQVPVDRIIEKQVQVLQPYPVHIEKIIEKKVPYPVQRLIAQPYPVHIYQPYPVEKIVEKAVHIPVTIEKIVEKKVHVPHPYPVQVPIKVPYPIELTKYVEQTIQVPYGVRYGPSYQEIMKAHSSQGLYANQGSTSLPVYGVSLVSNNQRDRLNESQQFQGYSYSKPTIAFVTGHGDSGNDQRSNGWEQFAFGKSSGNDNHRVFSKKSYAGEASKLPSVTYGSYSGLTRRQATHKQNNFGGNDKTGSRNEYVDSGPDGHQQQKVSRSNSHRKSKSRSSSDQQKQLLLEPVEQHSTAVTRTSPVSTLATWSRRARQQQENPPHYQSGPGAFRQSKIEYGFKPPMVPSIQYDEKTATKVEN